MSCSRIWGRPPSRIFTAQYLEFLLSTLLEIPKRWDDLIFASQIQVLISNLNNEMRRLAGTCKYFHHWKSFHFTFPLLYIWSFDCGCDRSELICCSHVLDFSVEWLLMSFPFSHFYGQASCSLEEGCLHALKKDCTIHWHNLGTKVSIHT